MVQGNAMNTGKNNTLISYNPSNGSIIGKTVCSTPEDVRTSVNKSKRAWSSWKKTPFAKRASYCKKLIELLKSNKNKIARLTSLEMGKPFTEALGDIDWELDFISYYAENAEKILGEKMIRKDKRAVYKTLYEPWGVVASIAPWNFPVSMASTGITAPLMAGNTVIFKPSEYTTLTQKLFVDLFNQTGLPEGVLQCVVGDGSVGKMLIDSDVNYVWFTGSTAVGQEIYKKCADKLIRCTLELGGSSPGIVFADCPLETTIETVYTARFYNCGQVCSAIKRLFVEKPVMDSVVDKLVQKVQSAVIGDPLDSKTTIGPLVSKKQLDILVSQIEDARKKGAKIIIGGTKPDDKKLTGGNYFLPTIITNVTENMRVFKEEVFGPVLPVMSFSSEKEAVRLANDTEYGLTAEIFTSDVKKGRRIAGDLDAGGISVNGDVIYSPHCPIGGFKKSGIGREYGEEGFKEFGQLKYICEYI